MSKNIWAILAVTFISLSLITGKAYGLIKSGDYFPSMNFSLSGNKDAQKYLAIKGDEEITISQVEADLLIIELLSVYCVSCMAQAPFDKELFSLIESNETTAGKVKMMGIAVGNNRAEVNKFIQKYSTPYPIFIDPTFSKYDQIGSVRTPFKIFLKRINNKFLIMKTEMGVNKNVQETFKTITSLLKEDYGGEKEVEVASIQKKSIDKVVVDNLLKEWLLQRGDINKVEELFEDLGRTVYKIGSKELMFAVLINRVSVCDVCKEIQFIYIIDHSGNVLDLLPIQLSKKYNLSFAEDDITKVKKSLIARNVNEDIGYDSKVDAITSATITTGLVYDSINKGSTVYNLLREKGFIQ